MTLKMAFERICRCGREVDYDVVLDRGGQCKPRISRPDFENAMMNSPKCRRALRVCKHTGEIHYTEFHYYPSKFYVNRKVSRLFLKETAYMSGVEYNALRSYRLHYYRPTHPRRPCQRNVFVLIRANSPD